MDELTGNWYKTQIIATELESSAFEIIGMPYDLYPTPDAPRQCRFWAHLMKFYLTRIIPEGSGFNLGSAQSYVDRVFIMVLGELLWVIKRIC